VVDDFPVNGTRFVAQYLQRVQDAHDCGEPLMAGVQSEPSDRGVAGV
jgi:hypothetical protein